MSISRWGPPIWIFLHTLAEKIKNETDFMTIKADLIYFLTQICKNLPCPTCSAHSSLLLKQLNFQTVNSKDDFKNILFLLHNAVNKSKKKPAFNISELSLQYENNKLFDTYNNFIAVFQTKGNMNLLTDSFQRKILINRLNTWLKLNFAKFIVV